MSAVSTVYSPDDAGPDERPPGLRRCERLWLDNRQPHEASRYSDRSQMIRVARAEARYNEMLSHAITAMTNATVGSPPQPGKRAERSGSDTPDPALAQINATYAALARGLQRLGHLLADCTDDAHEHYDYSMGELLANLGVPHDPDALADCSDALQACPVTRTAAVAAALDRAAALHIGAATALGEGWPEARREGAEPDLLEDTASRFERLAGRMAGLADSLGQWRPGPIVRTCRAGCGGAAPAKGDGATCERCRQRNCRAS